MKRYSIYGEIPEKLWLEDVFADNKKEAMVKFKQKFKQDGGYALVVLRKKDLPMSGISCVEDEGWNDVE